MGKMIKVTETRVYYYSPDLTEDYYVSEGIESLEGAFMADQADYRSKKISMDELSHDLPEVSAVWELVDE
jgi:hypothetical protein